MFSSIMRSLLAVQLLVIGLGVAGSVSADTQAHPTYQIIKATDSRVWRLNTRTGEIAVCSLADEQLLCTSSAQAITPPTKTYAELQAERAEQQHLDAQRRDEKRARSLAMLNIMMNAFKGIAATGSAGDGSN